VDFLFVFLFDICLLQMMINLIVNSIIFLQFLEIRPTLICQHLESPMHLANQLHKQKSTASSLSRWSSASLCNYLARFNVSSLAF